MSSTFIIIFKIYSCRLFNDPIAALLQGPYPHPQIEESASESADYGSKSADFNVKAISGIYSHRPPVHIKHFNICPLIDSDDSRALTRNRNTSYLFLEIKKCTETVVGLPCSFSHIEG